MEPSSITFENVAQLRDFAKDEAGEGSAYFWANSDGVIRHLVFVDHNPVHCEACGTPFASKCYPLIKDGTAWRVILSR